MAPLRWKVESAGSFWFIGNVNNVCPVGTLKLIWLWLCPGPVGQSLQGLCGNSRSELLRTAPPDDTSSPPAATGWMERQESVLTLCRPLAVTINCTKTERWADWSRNVSFFSDLCGGTPYLHTSWCQLWWEINQFIDQLLSPYFFLHGEQLYPLTTGCSCSTR